MPASNPVAPAVDTSSREIVITRVFDASPELVFSAYTDPKHIGNWWGPNGFSITTKQIDIRPGGVWVFTMHGPNGVDYPNRIVYLEIDKPRRLVYDHGAAGEDALFHTVVTFEAQGNKTKLTMTSLFPTVEARNTVVEKFGAIEGGNQHLACLADFIETSAPVREVVINRTFSAPREIVWKAWTERDRLQRWWGPKGFDNPVCEIDLRVGGGMKITMRAPDGAEHPMTATFLEIVPPERLVFTTGALNQQGEEMFEVRNSVTLVERGQQTELTMQATVIMATPEAAKYLPGMNQGWSMSLDKLAEEVAA